MKHCCFPKSKSAEELRIEVLFKSRSTFMCMHTKYATKNVTFVIGVEIRVKVIPWHRLFLLSLTQIHDSFLAQYSILHY